MKRIVYTRPDGGMSVVAPVIKKGKTIDEAIERCLNNGRSIPPDAIDIKVIATADMPTDRTYRNAWKQGVSGVEVDMPKARIIHTEKLLEAQVVKLKEIDREELAGANVTAERVTVRGFQAGLKTQIDAATTPEDLKAVWPVELRET